LPIEIIADCQLPIADWKSLYDLIQSGKDKEFSAEENNRQSAIKNRQWFKAALTTIAFA
jgi:hypothetical protein